MSEVDIAIKSVAELKNRQGEITDVVIRFGPLERDYNPMEFLRQPILKRYSLKGLALISSLNYGDGMVKAVLAKK